MNKQFMTGTFYNSKVDWWIPVMYVATVAVAFLGPIIDGEILIAGIIIGSFLGIMELLMFASVKYQICGNMLGVRNIFYRWEWLPIDKIAEVKKTSGILSAPALSTKRVSIKFADRSILKSSMPLEISPKDRDLFIARLKEINPSIEVN